MKKQLSITERTIRSHMSVMFQSVTAPGAEFVPESVILGFKNWVASGMTLGERKLAREVSVSILMQMERRVRIIRETLEQDVFKPFGG